MRLLCQVDLSAVLPDSEGDGAGHKSRLSCGFSALAVRLSYRQIPLGMKFNVPPGDSGIPLRIHHDAGRPVRVGIEVNAARRT